MKIDPITVRVRDLFEGYVDDSEGEHGIVGYGGMLDIRPPYQREFVYRDNQRDEVIRSVLAGFPINVMYWAARPDGTHEVLDGQQRTISICRYLDGAFPIDDYFFSNQPADIQRDILNYELTVCLCDGEPSEKEHWFRIVNIQGEKLTDQELRNATYPGDWLEDAKRYFSRRDCVAQRLGGDYVKGSPIRQELLETAIRWVSDDKIKNYMGRHQDDADAGELWTHYQAVINWVEINFPVKRPNLMQLVDWGSVYNAHRGDKLDAERLESEIKQLLSLEKPGIKGAIKKPAGVYRYVLDGDERHLNLRAFSTGQKTAAYERQGRKCVACGQEFDYAKMEGDHVISWRDGGLTTDDNLHMLCKPCNREKAAK